MSGIFDSISSGQHCVTELAVIGNSDPATSSIS